MIIMAEITNRKSNLKNKIRRMKEELQDLEEELERCDEHSSSRYRDDYDEEDDYDDRPRHRTRRNRYSD